MLATTIPSRATPVIDTSSPISFFTNTANLFLQTAGYNFTVANIPIYPTNYYTPAVHRLLQLAANIYDATTNKTSLPPNDFDYPSVFRPFFIKNITPDSTNVSIAGYAEVTNNIDFSAPMDLRRPADFAMVPMGIPALVNLYGVPYIIGAKRGFPSFSKFSSAPITQLTRKIQLIKSVVGGPVTQTNIQYIIGISNLMAVECWNSYLSNYSRRMSIYVTNELTMALTNELGVNFRPLTVTNGNSTFLPANFWSGYPLSPNQATAKASFILPLFTNIVMLPDSVMQPPLLISNTAVPFQSPSGFPAPQWVLSVTNRLRLMIVDQPTTDPATWRLIDYVELGGPEMDMTTNLTRTLQSGQPGQLGISNLWDTNRYPSGLNPNTPTVGIVSQIFIGSGAIRVSISDWANAQLIPISMAQATQGFNAWLNNVPDPVTGIADPSLTNQVPFTPTAKLSGYMTWQANDPLVHYLASDLVDPTQAGNPQPLIIPPTAPLTNVLQGLRMISPRYAPWNATGVGRLAATTKNAAFKDPLITRSDSWQFPTNLLSSIGSLGQVHRGTPWQTVYLKSTGIPNLKNWQDWTGNTTITTYIPNSNDPIYGANVTNAGISLPVNDWPLISALIPLLHPVNPRQLYSINETDPNAWASVFQGMTVLTNTSAGLVPLVIDANANSNALGLIAAGINAQRGNVPGLLYTNLDQILAVPQLSVASPFLNGVVATNFLTDAAYESIPAQLLPLLRLDSVGSIVNSGGVAQLQFTGVDGYNYNVQASTNLQDWFFIAKHQHTTNGVFIFSDRGALNFARRYYRTVLAP
ncbi:MAG: hypothetical protein JWQ04_269 [Pedosphaera sp.]|nr:hypothetical protein [Pedosphaera sp.]